MKYPYTEMSVEDIFDRVMKEEVKRCTITGGEPLLQRQDVLDLAGVLRVHGVRPSLETSGTLPLERNMVFTFSSIIMDLKPPSTEMDKHNKLENLENLFDKDFVKVVVSNLEDLDWLQDILTEYSTEARIAVGPRMLFGKGAAMAPSVIVEYMRKNKLYDWRLNLQLHKYIWPHTGFPELTNNRRPEDLMHEEYRMLQEEILKISL